MFIWGMQAFLKHIILDLYDVPESASAFVCNGIEMVL